MKWYKQKYVNHRDWIIDNLELLGLDEKEFLMVMMIDFMNEHKEPVSIESLHKKTGFTTEETDRIISVLCAKQYLEIKASAKSVRFELDGLFETNIAKEERILESSLYSAFESEFGRPLSQQEMAKISDWNKTTDKQLIMYALREASAYQNLNLRYIESILNDWKTKGITVQKIEQGKQDENNDNQ